LRAAEAPKELWLYYPINLAVDKNIDKTKETWSRAAKAGYTHVLLADSKFGRLAMMDKHYFANVEKTKKIAADLKLTIVPAMFDVGYSNNILGNDPNLAEGLPVKDQIFVVEQGVAKPQATPAVSFPNKVSFHDESVSMDGNIATIKSGGKKGMPARMNFKLKVAPYRCYHISVQIKTDGYQGKPEIKALAGKRTLQWENIHVKPTQDVTNYDVVFNSLDNEEVAVYFGDWSYKGEGTLTWKNWKIEEAGLVNVLRRPGTPFTVKGEDGKVYEEGKDFEKFVDPKMGTVPWAGEYKAWHDPVPLKVKGIADGTKLKVSWYHPAIIYDGQVSGCCQDPKFRELLADQARRMKQAWGVPGYMMSYDEFRTFGWDEPCRTSGKTPGQMLADSVRDCTNLVKPEQAYTWNDMFDPYHNAVEGPYYLVNGPWTGSWEGLPKEVVILNWNFGKRDQSLKFFADRGNPQILAAYYDVKPEDLATKTKAWMDSGSKVQGVVGVMYTTWRNDYSQMEKFAEVVKGK
jgi:hypothetical protein